MLLEGVEVADAGDAGRGLSHDACSRAGANRALPRSPERSGFRRAAASRRALQSELGISLLPSSSCVITPWIHNNVPRRACSRSMASKSALKLPLPKLRAPRRWMISKNSVGRSSTGLVKIWSR